MRSEGRPATEAAQEVEALGWTPAEVKSRLAKLPPAGDLDSVAQTVSFGAADEMSAGLRAPLRALMRGTSLGDAYDSALEDSRTALELYRDRAPVRSTLAEVLGAALMPIPGGAPRSAIGAVAKAAGVAGAEGAAYGFGTGEGLDNRIDRSIIGGAFGLGTGGALGLGETVLRGLISQAPGGARGTARAMLADALADEGMTGGQAADMIAAARQAGARDTGVMDVAQGGRVLGLFEDVVGSPNRAQAPLRKQIETRQMGVRGPLGDMEQPGQYERLMGRLGDLAGIGDRRAVQTAAEIAARRSQAATPAFNQAWQFDPASNADVRAMLSEVSQTPLFREAWPRAIKIAQSKARGVPTPNIYDLSDETGQLRYIPDMRFLHFLKEGMDDAVNAAYKSGDGNLGSAYKEVRNLFRNTLKTSNPAYRAALDQFSGASALEEAVADGAAMMMKSPDELAAAFKGLSESEKESFRIGALTKVVDVLGAPRRGPARDVAGALNSPNFIKKIAVLMPDDAARAHWFAFADNEAAKSVTAKKMFGSPTAPRQEVSEMMDANEGAGRIIADAGRGMHGSFWDMLMGALSKISKPIADFSKRQRRGEMGEMLGQTDQLAEAFLRALDQRPPVIGYQTQQIAAPAAVATTAPLLPAPQPDPLLDR
jgi:hypothetical protein